jgi:hypothetical protein
MQVPDYVDINKCYMIFYIQNKESNEILQSRTVPISKRSISTSPLAPQIHLQQKQIYEQNGLVKFSFIVQNPNPHPVQYNLQTKVYHCTMTTDFQVVSNTTPKSTITLLPFQYYPITLEGEMESCNQDAMVEISFQGEIISVQIPILQAQKARWFQRIYPQEVETFASGKPWFIIQTLHGTKLMKTNNDTPIAIANQGILLFKPDIEVGTNQFQYALVFPDQTTQDIEYFYFQVVEMEFQLSSDVMQIDQERKVLNYPLFLYNNRTMIGLVDVSESIGCYVEFDAVTKAITLRLNEKSITMFMNSSKAYVGDEKFILDVPPQVTTRGSFLPLRFVYENFGFTVSWEASSQIITLTNQP